MCTVFYLWKSHKNKKSKAFTFTNTNILFNMKQPNSMCYNFPRSYYKTWFAQSGYNNQGVHFVQLNNVKECNMCAMWIRVFFISAKVAIYSTQHVT